VARASISYLGLTQPGHGVPRRRYRSVLPARYEIEAPDACRVVSIALAACDGTETFISYPVVFNACRNELRLPTRDTSKSLVAEQQGYFIAYASAPGRTASDRGERSGPYAAALAMELGRQGIDHLSLLQNVKEAVIGLTGGAQLPSESNGLSRRVYLTGEPTTPADIPLWESVRSSGDILLCNVILILVILSASRTVCSRRRHTK
jgi:hypothetical protein